MKYVLRTFLLMLVAACSGCVLFWGKQAPSTPRADMTRWLPEHEVIEQVVLWVNYSQYASRRPGIVRQYAQGLRRWYGDVSQGGADVDGGMRAMNRVYQIHQDAKGSWSLWCEVMKLAADKNASLQGLPVPFGQEYERKDGASVPAAGEKRK